MSGQDENPHAGCGCEGLSNFRLLDLPPEIRQTIYEFALDTPLRIKAHHLPEYDERGIRQATVIDSSGQRLRKWRRPGDDELLPKTCKTSILRVSKMVSAEALDVLYGRRMFSVGYFTASYKNLSIMGDANLRRIRHLHIKIQHLAYADYAYSDPDHDAWGPLLHRLARLDIVARQPLGPPGDLRDMSLEDRVEAYEDCLSRIMRAMRMHLSGTENIFVDAGGHRESLRAMYFNFGEKFRQFEASSEDEYFRRGKYTPPADGSDDDSWWWNEGYCTTCEGHCSA